MFNNKYNRRSVIIHSLRSLLLGVAWILLALFKKSAHAITPEFILDARNRITPSMPADEFARPDYFPPTNNLRRKAGSSFFATGESLIIEGYITDLANVPIDGARVKIWQANHAGYYNHLTDEDDHERHDIDFLPGGISITDNLGYFCFYTIMPGFYGERTPHIHFFIEHKSFDTIETEMFFPNHPKNYTDKVYQSLSPRHRRLVTAALALIDPKSPASGKTARFNIKLDGLHPYKRY